MDIIISGIVFWFLFLAGGMANGIIREYSYKKKLGDLKAHQVSTVIFAIYVILVSYLFVLVSGTNYSELHYLILGFVWVIATVIFEFGFGRYNKKSWDVLLGDYNIFKGRLWSLIIVLIGLMPYVFRKYFF